ncbi:MAG: 16S rRNA (uracil(1498)-N(3))-methyltransferase [Paludibacteraceae bacterium]|nr:16S rRNA (uracil(1498)-N(3))-methyltransferase [Paludibacteraceae bacterium]
MYLFYTPDIEQNHCLSEEESQHCVRVLRYDRGDEILLTDGRGTTYQARITNPHPKHCEFEILSSQKQEPHHHFHLHIAIAPTKNIERLEWMVEKCTEIGVDEITPLLCRFSERKQLRTDRLEKIILSAAKQSLTPYLPVLHDLTKFEDFISLNSTLSTTLNSTLSTLNYKYIAHCYERDKRSLKDEILSLNSKLSTTLNSKLSTTLNSKLSTLHSITILIGPEGDFSEQEVDLALQNGYVPVSLGNSRLRTETAGVVACHTAILLNE